MDDANAEGEIAAVHVQPRKVLDGPITLVEHDPAWKALYQREATRIRAALGDRVLLIEHVGSTAVPGIAAKPKIDIVLAVADSRRESDYVPALEAVGYVLRIREPGWYEHRLFGGPDTVINLHVFSDRCEETNRLIRFRDRLRSSEADRLHYESTKRALAQQKWMYTQNYADAKSAVVEEILARSLVPRRGSRCIPEHWRKRAWRQAVLTGRIWSSLPYRTSSTLSPKISIERVAPSWCQPARS